MPPAVQAWFDHLRAALADGSLVKVTLGAARGSDPTLRQLTVRPVLLRAGPRLACVYRHATRDVTRNLTPTGALEELARRLGRDFGSAHLFTTALAAELDWPAAGEPVLRVLPPRHTAPADLRHDRVRAHLIEPAEAPWLRDLGITTRDDHVRPALAAKFRQIQKFTEILRDHLAAVPALAGRPVRLVDMGCGKGYLTFAAYEWLRRRGPPPEVLGIEARPELVALCNQVAARHGFTGLRFIPGTIADASLDAVDVLVALHACDTATDDALARGVRAGAAVLVTAPCCHKELRPQLRAGPAWAGLLRHGILRERQADLVTDALRAALLEWAGYAARVFEFIAPEHTAKNLMLAATRRDRPRAPEPLAATVRALAATFGIRRQRLAEHLGFALEPEGSGAAPLNATPNVGAGHPQAPLEDPR